MVPGPTSLRPWATGGGGLAAAAAEAEAEAEAEARGGLDTDPHPPAEEQVHRGVGRSGPDEDLAVVQRHQAGRRPEGGSARGRQAELFGGDGSRVSDERWRQGGRRGLGRAPPAPLQGRADPAPPRRGRRYGRSPDPLLDRRPPPKQLGPETEGPHQDLERHPLHPLDNGGGHPVDVGWEHTQDERVRRRRYPQQARVGRGDGADPPRHGQRSPSGQAIAGRTVRAFAALVLALVLVLVLPVHVAHDRLEHGEEGGNDRPGTGVEAQHPVHPVSVGGGDGVVVEAAPDAAGQDHVERAVELPPPEQLGAGRNVHVGRVIQALGQRLPSQVREHLDGGRHLGEPPHAGPHGIGSVS